MSSDAFADAAAAIGRKLVADAVWHGDRCSWMGAVNERTDPGRPEYRPLGPSFYDGTAGVGLFLARLAAVTADRTVLHAARGALRHAISRTGSLASARRDGFHAGTAGIAWAVARAAMLLDDEALFSGAPLVLAAARQPAAPLRCPDLVTGAAGWIVGLVALAELLDDPGLLAEAVVVGEALLGQATVTSHGWSWRDPTQRYPAHLCGVSHGAAGIGLSFVELFAATGDDRFRIAALGAFAYERSWFDAHSGAWPDLRVAGVRRREPRVVPSTTGTWCHGAPGIAASRLRAIAVLGTGPHEEDARAALSATRRDVCDSLAHDTGDMSPCHGASGPADVLLSAATDQGAEWRSAADLAAHVGAAALERHEARDAAWPCGVLSGTTPALFTGLSGIGWWFLRLHDPAVPSVLRFPSAG